MEHCFRQELVGNYIYVQPTKDIINRKDAHRQRQTLRQWDMGHETDKSYGGSPGWNVNKVKALSTVMITYGLAGFHLPGCGCYFGSGLACTE